MPRLILVRPAETDYASQGIYQGRLDLDLNETGLKQAANLGFALEAYHPTFLAASPLKRCLSTALSIEYAVSNLTTTTYSGFEAADLGDWQSLGERVITGEDRSRFHHWLEDPDFRAPGGESIREVYARALPELVHIVEHAQDNETIVLVLQETVLRAMTCAILDLPLEHAQRFAMEPAHFAIFERIYHRGPYRMLSWNQVASEEDALQESLAAIPDTLEELDTMIEGAF